MRQGVASVAYPWKPTASVNLSWNRLFEVKRCGVVTGWTLLDSWKAIVGCKWLGLRMFHVEHVGFLWVGLTHPTHTTPTHTPAAPQTVRTRVHYTPRSNLAIFASWHDTGEDGPNGHEHGNTRNRRRPNYLAYPGPLFTAWNAAFLPHCSGPTST